MENINQPVPAAPNQTPALTPEPVPGNNNPASKKKLFIALATFLVVIAGGIFYFTGASADEIEPIPSLEPANSTLQGKISINKDMKGLLKAANEDLVKPGHTEGVQLKWADESRGGYLVASTEDTTYENFVKGASKPWDFFLAKWDVTKADASKDLTKGGKWNSTPQDIYKEDNMDRYDADKLKNAEIKAGEMVLVFSPVDSLYLKNAVDGTKFFPKQYDLCKLVKGKGWHAFSLYTPEISDAIKNCKENILEAHVQISTNTNNPDIKKVFKQVDLSNPGKATHSMIWVYFNEKPKDKGYTEDFAVVPTGGEKQITLKFAELDKQSEISYFTIAAKKSSDKDFKLLGGDKPNIDYTKIQSDKYEIVIKDLAEDTSYDFEIVGSTKNNKGLVKKTVSAKTLSGKAATEFTETIKAAAIGFSNSIRIEIEKPDAKSQIAEYKIALKSAPEAVLKTVKVDAQLVVQIDNLDKDKKYEFVITAYDKAGKVLATKDVSATTTDKTTSEVEIIKAVGDPLDKSIRVTITKPAPEHKVVTYSAEYKKNNVEKYEMFNKSIPQGDVDVVFDVTGLTPSTKYSIKLIAFDKDGKQIAEEILNVKTLASDEFSYTAPLNLKAEWATAEQLKITWQAPANAPDKTALIYNFSVSANIDGQTVDQSVKFDTTKENGGQPGGKLTFSIDKAGNATMTWNVGKVDADITFEVYAYNANDTAGEKATFVLTKKAESPVASAKVAIVTDEKIAPAGEYTAEMTGKRLVAFTLTSDKDVSLKEIKIHRESTKGTDLDFTKIGLFNSGGIKESTTLTNGVATFKLATPLLLKKGEPTKLVINGDISKNPLDGSVHKFGLTDKTDLVFDDAKAEITSVMPILGADITLKVTQQASYTAPENLKLEVIDNKLVISWEPPANATIPVKKYGVQLLGSTDPAIITVDPPSTNAAGTVTVDKAGKVTITGETIDFSKLEKDLELTINVYAFNEDGSNGKIADSTIIIKKTVAAAALTFPQAIIEHYADTLSTTYGVSNDTEKLIHLVWSAQADPNKDTLIGYEITYKLSDSNDIPVVIGKDKVTANLLSYDIYDDTLIAGPNYDITLETHYKSGKSQIDKYPLRVLSEKPTNP